MTNRQIAKLLRNVAAAYSIKDEKKYRFQLLAYQKASDAIENATSEIKDLYVEDKLDELPGVGTSIKSSLKELITKGKVEHFNEILHNISYCFTHSSQTSQRVRFFNMWGLFKVGDHLIC